MDTDKPISELVELLASESSPADLSKILRDLERELEVLIDRHQIEGASRALGLFEASRYETSEDVDFQ